MAGRLVPLVMYPRYSSFAGRSDYTTVPLDVSGFSKAVLTCWRGPHNLTPASGGVVFFCQESSDQVVWVTCSGTNVDAFDPGEDTEGVASANLRRRWFRVMCRVYADALEQNGARVTCWSVGHLVAREP